MGYDADTGAVALRAAPNGAKGRYRLRTQSNGSSLVDGRRFLAHHGLKVEKAQRFPAEEFGEGLEGFRFPEGKSEADSQATQGKTARTGKRKATATA